MEKLQRKNPVVDELVRAKLTAGLSDGQADAFMLLKKFMTCTGPDMFVLKGYAGTGKTYLVAKVIEYINKLSPGCKIAVTAPTNKAVQVLLNLKEFKAWNVQYQTIHSLLGLTETIDSNGKVSFTNKNGNSDQLSKMKYLIVDEVSMLQDDIFKMIEKHSTKVKIIFMGDPAQIPPVGKTDCIPFKRCLSTEFEEGYTLLEIMRQQKGNPIIEASFKLRDNLEHPNPIPVLKTEKDDKGHGLTWIDPVNDRDGLLHLLETHFTSIKFKEDSDYAKVIAWRNKTVATVNARIREMIYGETPQKIMTNERMLANKPIFDDEGEILYNTSEELQVGSFTIVDKTLKRGQFQFKGKVYECTIKKPLQTTSKNPLLKSLAKGDIIKILHEDSEADFAKFLDELKQRAINNKGANKSWIDFYDMLKWPADVAYNYAITAHKAQGSTYENVFLMEDDMNANSNVVERNRIKYTSYSRASKNLYVYRVNQQFNQ